MTGTSHAYLSVHAGADAHVSCARYPQDKPILSIHATDLSFSLSAPGPHEVTAADVAFASSLARSAAAYAAECARLHAAQAHRPLPAACDCAQGQAAAPASAGEPA